MSNINELNDRFGLGGKLRFSVVGEGITVADVQTADCTARVSLQGAQVLEWTPKGQKPVVWLSQDSRFTPGKSIRGGVPICWPWFGAHNSNPDFPAHGYARTVPWILQEAKETDNGGVRLSLKLQENESLQGMWPYKTPLELHIHFAATLEIELLTRNEDSQPVQISEALHTYFAVGDIRKVRVSGLDKVEYLDKVRDFTRTEQEGDIRFESEVDRVYLDTTSECIIDDESWQRRIHISKKGSQSTVVWNPWQDKATAMGDMGSDGFLSMLCVESANAANNIVTIEPGAEHRLMVRYHVEE